MRSAGIALVRVVASGAREVLLAHPGGPFFVKKDDGAWSLPKGLVEVGEEALAAARRELREELGPDAITSLGDVFVDLGEVVLRGGKIVQGFAARGECDVTRVRGNEFELEWPPRSGRRARFPEIDRALWCDATLARVKIAPAQWPLVERALSDETLAALGLATSGRAS